MPSRGIRPEQVTRRHLYVDERLPMREIAARLGCGPTTIARCLRRFGIEARRTPPLDVLRSRPAGSSAQAGQGRALHVEDALESCGSGAGVEKLAYSWRSKRHARKGLEVRLPSPAPFLDKLPRAPVGFVGVGL